MKEWIDSEWTFLSDIMQKFQKIDIPTILECHEITREVTDEK